MYKKIVALALTVCMLVMTAGCSMFASEEGGKEEGKGGETSENGVKITEKFTHEDPTDIEFDERVVLQIPEGSDYFTMTKEQADVSANTDFIILYGKEDKPVAYYEYLVVDTEKDASTYVDFMGEVGIKVETDGLVAWFSKSGDEIDAEVASFMAMNMMEKETFADYVNFFEQSYVANRVE